MLKCQNVKKSKAFILENDKNTKFNIKKNLKILEYISLLFFEKRMSRCH